MVLTHEDKAYWGDLSNIDVIYNHVPYDELKQASLTNKRAIAVGRLTYQKGFDHLIKIWSLVHKKHPDWQLDIFEQANCRTLCKIKYRHWD